MPRSLVKLDLLAAKPLRALARWAGFPVVFQAVALVAIGALVVNGLGVGPGATADELLTLRKTNLTTLVVWGLWWPGMIAVALAVGRAWCTVCPMELVNRVGDATARKLAIPRLPLGRVLRAGWFVVAGYAVLQLLVAGFSIHRVPHATAILLLVLLGVALLTGLVFREPRSFCRSFCPASALLSVYGRYTPVQLEMRDPSVCERCATKDCIRAENRHRLEARSCPSLLRPFDRTASDGCVLCLQCAKVCPHDNVGVGLVAAAAPVRRRGLLRPFEAAFVMLALGFVAHETIGEVRWLDGLFHAIPLAVARQLPSVPFGWLEAGWFLVVFPGLAWAVIAGAGYVAGHRGGTRSLLLAAATGAAPVVAVAHLAKAAAKVASWGGFLPLSLRDPRGIQTLDLLGRDALAKPAGLVGLDVVGWVMLGLTALVAWHATRWIRKLPGEAAIGARAGAAGAALLYTAVLVFWSWPAA